jgi:hypothetical protein
MKTTRLNVRMSERRLNKLRQYAANKDKTVTQIVEDWIDRLSNTEIDKNSTTSQKSNLRFDVACEVSRFDLAIHLITYPSGR